MFNKKIVLFTVMISLALFGCNKNENKDTDIKEETEEVEESFTEEDSEEMFIDRDYEESYDKEKCVYIKMEDNKITCDKKTVKIKESKVIIQEEGIYVVSGKIDDGMIMVDAKKKDDIQLVLKDVDITSKTSAPIYVKEANKVFITLDKKSKNILSNGGEFKKSDKDNIDGVIFSKSDVTINGEGNVNIENKAGHGIVSKDDLVITNGNINVKASEHGLTGKDSVRIDGGNLYLESGKDGIYGNNEKRGHVYIGKGNLEIKAKDDGIHANNNLIINNGKINILESYEGLEGKCIDIIKGNVNIVASDDGINVAGGKDKSGIKGTISSKEDKFNKGNDCYINISGGEILVESEGDGIDSKGSILVSGGETYISGTTKAGNEAIDFSTSAQVTGGRFIATGDAEMEMNFNENSVQGAILVEIKGDEKDEIQVIDDKNKLIFKCKAKKEFEAILLSCLDLKQGNEYIVKVRDKKEKITMNRIIYGGKNNMNNQGNQKNEKLDKDSEKEMYKIKPPRPRRGENNN